MSDASGETKLRPALVIYHGSCTDGFCAAWLLRKYLGNDAKYWPTQHGEEPPAKLDLQNRDIYIVDFSYPRDVLISMNELCKPGKLVVLDHHKTAAAELADLPFATFDMNKSGARLTWDYLASGPWSNDIIMTIYRNWLVDYTEDRDLWRFALPESRAINAAIRSYPLNFEEWDKLSLMGVHEIATEGRAIQRYRDQLIESHVRNARTIELAGHQITAAPCTAGEIISEVAEKLAEGMPFGACYFDIPEGYRVFSLRSREGGIDVSDLAKHFGGGGHKHAAGFKIPLR